MGRSTAVVVDQAAGSSSSSQSFTSTAMCSFPISLAGVASVCQRYRSRALSNSRLTGCARCCRHRQRRSTERRSCRSMLESATDTCGSSIRCFRRWKCCDSTEQGTDSSVLGVQKPSCNANPSKRCRFGLPICGRHRQRGEASSRQRRRTSWRRVLKSTRRQRAAKRAQRRQTTKVKRPRFLRAFSSCCAGRI
jgi:hypothetical protein